MELYLDDIDPKYKSEVDRILESLKGLEKYVSIFSTDEEMIHVNFSKESPLEFCEHTEDSMEFGHLDSVSFLCDKRDVVVMISNSFSYFDKEQTYNWNDEEMADGSIIQDDPNFSTTYTTNFYRFPNWRRFTPQGEKFLLSRARHIFTALFEYEFSF